MGRRDLSQTSHSLAVEPKVSVITPVYNGAKHLAAAIESVLDQTYANWEYVVVDNCSKDQTRAIAEDYARRDPRVRVAQNESFLPIIANWNMALSHVSDDSSYCKVLHADDWLLPDCLARMVELAEQQPGVGLVGSYIQEGDEIAGKGLPVERQVFSGREVCRDTLLDRYYAFGSPSALLLRSEEIRRRPQGFYNEQYFHADLEACYRVLMTCDFGFIHDALTGSRKHAESMTNTVAWRFSTHMVEYLGMMRTYGPYYLDDDMFEREHEHMLRTYRRLLARRIISGRGREFWSYHKTKMKQFGYDLTGRDILIGAVGEIGRLLVSPGYATAEFPKMYRAMKATLLGASGKESNQRAADAR